MAAIDKSLPNEVRTNIKLPNPKEVQQEQQQQVAGDMMNPVDIQKNEDGSVDINFDPNAVYDNESCSFLSTTNSKKYFSDNLELLDSSPNPFNPITTIQYRMNLPNNIRISIYDINGNPIIDVFNGYKNSGSHTIEWDAENLPSGVYFVRLNAGEFTKTQKLMLVK